MNVVSVSFESGDKMITLKRDIESGEEIRKVVSALLKEAQEVGVPGKASPAQLRAIYARAIASGWNKEKVKEMLKNKLGTSSRNEIVGMVDKQDLSRLIDEIGPAPEVEGKATSGQLKALWAKALSKGWERARIRTFLQEKIGADKDGQIVGHVDRKLVSSLIDQLALA
ncbi:MAG: hypothetical protein U9N73_12255 [Candidatus Auribacterota bacterium]|nr:hypothetical protein [Candidatus Auribacterota bacterium]